MPRLIALSGFLFTILERCNPHKSFWIKRMSGTSLLLTPSFLIIITYITNIFVESVPSISAETIIEHRGFSKIL